MGINDTISKIESTVETNNTLRREMIARLAEATRLLKFDEINNMRSSELESRLGVFTTLDSLMKSEEAASINTVKITLAKQNTDTNVSTAETVSELLRRVKVGDALRPTSAGQLEDHSIIDATLDAEITSLGVAPIRDEEVSLDFREED